MTVTGIISWLVIGGVVGGLGRLVVPGRQPIPIWLMVLVGTIAASVGSFLAVALGLSPTSGIDWLELLFQVVLAAIGVTPAANLLPAVDVVPLATRHSLAAHRCLPIGHLNRRRGRAVRHRCGRCGTWCGTPQRHGRGAGLPTSSACGLDRSVGAGRVPAGEPTAATSSIAGLRELPPRRHVAGRPPDGRPPTNGLHARRGVHGRRLDDPADNVRLEIEYALGLNKVVMPVLVNDVVMPHIEQVPDRLRPLLRLNALHVRHLSWDRDIEELVRDVRRRRP